MTKPRLLVVDDEAYLRSAIGRWFEASGFDVDTAEDGEVAVARCREKQYDIVTMDLVMPNMDGATAIRAIREIQPETAIVVFSGYPDSFNLGTDSGVTRVLAKPMTMTELEKELRSLLADPG